jgi:hypothetical protein
MSEMRMPPDALHDLNRQLGMVIAGLDAMRRDLAASEAKSDRPRGDVHRRLDELVNQVGEIDTTVSVTGARLETVETTIKDRVMPTVGKVDAWEQRGIGALATAGMAGSAIGAALVYFWAEIVAKLTRTG